MVTNERLCEYKYSKNGNVLNEHDTATNKVLFNKQKRRRE
jgi:hypothetical protein